MLAATDAGVEGDWYALEALIAAEPSKRTLRQRLRELRRRLIGDGS